MKGKKPPVKTIQSNSSSSSNESPPINLSKKRNRRLISSDDESETINSSTKEMSSASPSEISPDIHRKVWIRDLLIIPLSSESQSIFQFGNPKLPFRCARFDLLHLFTSDNISF